MRRAGIAVAAVLVWGEWQTRRWSRMLVGPARDGALAVVVPGFHNPQPTANLINRWRARIAVRCAQAAEDAEIVFSGGATAGGAAEADLLADYARGHLGYTGRATLETASRTTWENVTNVLPLIEHADRIVFASQPAHALKARAYLCRQRPDLADRLGPGADHRVGEYLLLKPVLALYGLWTLRGLDPSERQVPR